MTLCGFLYGLKKRIPVLGIMLGLSLEDLHKNVHHPIDNTLETPRLLWKNSVKQMFRSCAINEGGKRVSAHEKQNKKPLTSNKLVTQEENPGYSGLRKPWMHRLGSFIITWTSGLDWDSHEAGVEKKAKIKWASTANGASYWHVVKVLQVYFWWMGRRLESIYGTQLLPRRKRCSLKQEQHKYLRVYWVIVFPAEGWF